MPVCCNQWAWAPHSAIHFPGVYNFHVSFLARFAMGIRSLYWSRLRISSPLCNEYTRVRSRSTPAFQAFSFFFLHPPPLPNRPLKKLFPSLASPSHLVPQRVHPSEGQIRRGDQRLEGDLPDARGGLVRCQLYERPHHRVYVLAHLLASRALVHQERRQREEIGEDEGAVGGGGGRGENGEGLEKEEQDLGTRKGGFEQVFLNVKEYMRICGACLCSIQRASHFKTALCETSVRQTSIREEASPGSEISTAILCILLYV